MKLGIVVYSGDSETVWNAFRFANFSLAMADKVMVFLLGKGVECDTLDTGKFMVSEQMKSFLEAGGKGWVCSTCLEIHKREAPKMFSLATLKNLHDIVEQSDRVLTF